MARRENAAEFAASAQRAARIVALELVTALGAAHARFAAGEPGALHDVRVAVRRLRSWMRAYHPVLDDTVSAKSRRGMRRLADATSQAREAEVSLEMLGELPAAPPRARTGRADLQRRLTREAERSGRDTDKALGGAIPRLTERLTRELSHVRIDVPLDGELRVEPMDELTADIVARHGERLARALEAFDDRSDEAGPDTVDQDEVHRVRIAAKRLRYIVERLTAQSPRAAALVERLTALQDTLGDYRDVQLLGKRALAEIGRSARNDARARTRALLAKADGTSAEQEATRSRVRPGLLDVARGADARARAAWQKFETDWPRGERAEELRAEVSAVVDELAHER